MLNFDIQIKAFEREGKIMYRIETECQEFNWLIWEEDEYLDIALRKFDMELKNKYSQMKKESVSQ